ncbi:MAG TPA: polysaccharide deacetylase family protein [Fimbriimonadaceae bacterium]|nr:polysaccharide deacetylase family protein [Fimbriimonadaceae bacterium]
MMRNLGQLAIWMIVACGLFGAFVYLGWKNSAAALPRPFPSLPGAPAPEQTSTPAPPPVPDLVMQAQSGRAVVIMYHDVIKQRDRNSVWFDCTTEEFQKDVDEIVQNGFTVLSLDQLYDHLTTGKPIPEKSIVLTFDDNYQGVYDNALPILRKYKFPAAVFVHTAYVGSQTGHPKMTWDELKELHSEGLITIGAHTVTHPSDLKDLPAEQQKKELDDSKKTLEDHLGGDIPYMAYPDGSNDAITQQLAREAGYKMSFTMEPTPAEGSPNVLCVGRYEAKKFDTALKTAMDEEASGQIAVADVQLKKNPVVSCEAGKFDGIKMVLLHGGSPVSILSSGREMVGDFVAQNNGVAGINGTFFVMAAIASSDNRMIGPCRPQNLAAFVPDTDVYRMTKLVDRPMVIWGPTRFAIVPFQPDAMNQEDIFRRFMPDYTDSFLAGAWIVHNGQAKTLDEMRPYASQDIMDFRKRVFFGVTKDGEYISGASQGSITTETLAKAAVAAGAFEAILLDSGFSTSVVFDGQILASGHSSIDQPSRPVPHAIVFQGEKGTSNIGDLVTVPVVITAQTDGTGAGEVNEERPKAKDRRRHRRR